jgi:hypothetical protein
MMNMAVLVAVWVTVAAIEAVAVGVRVAVRVGVPVGRTICVGRLNNALTVMTAAVLYPSISGSVVDSDRISAAVGGVGSKNAMAYTIQTMPKHIVTARSPCNGIRYSLALM